MFLQLAAKYFNRQAYRLLILLALFFVNDLSAQGFLKTKGKTIINGKGETVILRGMGLGGWMLQEGYMFKLSNLGQQYRIKEKIIDVVGEEKANLFYDQWLTHHTTKTDIDSMAAWGFNSIRLPMHYGLYTLPVEKEPVAGQQTWIQKGFDLTDSLLAWCKANKIYLILDMHAAPGGQGNDLAISDRDSSKPSLWQSQAAQDKLIALWKKLADRYKNEQWIGAYDIINEPNWGFEDPKDFRGTAEKKNEPLRKLLMDMTAAIRSVDKNHIIIIEGNGFGNNYNGILPGWDKNLVLSFHKYGNFNTTAAIKHFLDLRDKYDLPLWLGESGENSNTWFTEAIGLVEKHGIGWAWWQEKKMNINNPLEIKIPAGYDKLLAYWASKGEKPSEADAWKTLQELITNLKISNNVYHKDVVDAMFRQVNSRETIPFKKHSISANAIIEAVDFDMGRQGIAYFDRDTASYHYTPGVNTRGNRGSTYRNDGVDIARGEQGPYIFNIEDGEWLQYTVTVPVAGKYTVSFATSSKTSAGQVSLLSNGKTVVKPVILPVTGDEEKWELSAVKNISLEKGTNKLRVYADKGGFNLKRMQFDRE